MAGPGKTLILTATYNERDNAPQMYERLRDLELDADILFVDDNSPDGTGTLLEELAARDSRLFVLHRPGKLGVGGAHYDGIQWAYDRGYETVIALDCDFTHSPEDIPRLLEAGAEHDVVVGSRYLVRGSLPNWNPFRKLLTNVGHILTLVVLGLPWDATGSFRLYRISRIPREIFALIASRGYSFFFESLFILSFNGVTIQDLPIVLPARTYGHSKMSYREAWRSVTRVFRLGILKRTSPWKLRAAKPRPEADVSLPSSSEWDSYWTEKADRGSIVYETVATIYRNLVIRRQLCRAIRREFVEGSRLLHAGCGGGQVDAGLHSRFRISAVDLSLAALDLYRRVNPEAPEVRQASVFRLPYPDRTFDGVYNLGVVEHFDEAQIESMLRECARVLTPAGKIVLFWPHRFGSSVIALGLVHRILRSVFRSDRQLHPPEISLVRSSSHARKALDRAGLALSSYRFGPADGFVQAIVVGRRA